MKTVLLSGGTRGLGLAILERLLADGYKVIALGRSPSAEFETVMEAAGDRAAFYQLDLSDLSGIPTLVSEVVHHHGSLYGLVNNAGIGADGLLATMHASDISLVLRTNLESAIVMTKYACRSMLLRGEGRIVSISSIIASTGFNGLSVYAASKAGLEGFTRSLARELGRARITVNCVAPGFMETNMTAGLIGDKLTSIRRRTPIDLPRVEDAAGAVAYLMSPDGARVTGTTLTVDGGSTA